MRDPAGAGSERTERAEPTVKVMRQKYFGAKPELAASGLTRAQAEQYIAECQSSNDGYAYSIER